MTLNRVGEPAEFFGYIEILPGEVPDYAERICNLVERFRTDDYYPLDSFREDLMDMLEDYVVADEEDTLLDETDIL